MNRPRRYRSVGRPGRFSERDIIEIRKTYDAIKATPTVRELAKRWGTHVTTITNIGNRLLYKWVGRRGV